MKTILILNPYISTLGGGEKHMGYLCQFFEQYFNYNVKIEILVFEYETNVDATGSPITTVDAINKTFGLNLQKTYIKVLHLEREASRWLRLKNKRLVESISKEYDIFVNFMFLSKHVGKAKKNVYEVMFPARKTQRANPLKHLIWWRMDKRFLNSYDVFISNSQFTNNWLKKYWGTRLNANVVYPPVFTEKDNLTDRYVEKMKENIIISVGRFFVSGHNKKQLEMVKFFVQNQDKLSGLQYHLVGQCSERKEDIDYLNQIKEVASKVKNVFIHTNSPYSDLIELYKRSKIFWHGTGYGVDENQNPEQMEHFGITTVEAMSFGAVPVVINKGGQKETVENGVNGFRWDTEEECVDFTAKLLSDDSLRIKMAEESTKRAKNYSVDEFYAQNRKVMNELKI